MTRGVLVEILPEYSRVARHYLPAVDALRRAQTSTTQRDDSLPSSTPVKGLFTIEGVDLSARRSPGRGRGLPRMKVPTRLIWKTSTCPTLLSRTASAVLT